MYNKGDNYFTSWIPEIKGNKRTIRVPFSSIITIQKCSHDKSCFAVFVNAHKKFIYDNNILELKREEDFFLIMCAI